MEKRNEKHNTEAKKKRSYIKQNNVKKINKYEKRRCN